jgi:hypothetical protein
MPIGRGEENDVSRRQLALNRHFLLSDKLKIQIQRGLKIVNLRVRLTLRYHFLPLVKITNDLGPEEKVMFQGFRRLCNINSFLFPSHKFDLVGVQKAMYNVISDPLYLFFYFLTNRKHFLRELKKGVSGVRLALFILASSNPKIRIVRGREFNDSGDSRPSKLFFCPLEHINVSYLTSRKGIFRESPSY